MAFALKVIRGKQRDKTIPLPDEGAMTIGRDSCNALRIKDRKLSRIHCQFEVRDDECYLSDLNSTNGTLVNDDRIEQETQLEIGDEIQIGTTRFRLAASEGAEATAFPEEDEQTPGEGPAGPPCEECGRNVTPEEMAEGTARSVGERYYCSSCVASFEQRDEEIGATPSPVEERQRPEPLAPGTVVADVRIVATLADSRIGRLYRAIQKSIGREVTFKLLDIEDREWARKYIESVYASGQLVHQNIALIFDTGDVDGSHYVVREYVEGEPLEAVLSRHESLELSDIYTIITQIGYAIEYSDERDMPHGSLSPRKILIGENRVVKVIGFGLPQAPPKDLDEDQYRRHALPYTPPERLSYRARLNPSADCYALVAIFYHMLTGEPPFRGRTASQIKSAVRKGSIQPAEDMVEGIPDAAKRIIQRGFHADADSRYQRPAELLHDLEDQLRPEL